MDDARVVKLTEGQRDCLRLVLQHMSSKDIARVLGISPHTVDQRLKLAMKTLGAATRVDAARRLAAAEGHQTLAYQPPDIAPPAEPHSSPASDEGRETTRHDRLRRYGWFALIAAAIAVGFAALFVGLNALSEFTR